MEWDELFSGLILEKARFGRAGTQSVWVETKSIRAFAEKAVREKSLGLDWLENFQVAKMDDALVISYWVRGFEGASELIFRCSVKMKKNEPIELPSMRDLWPMIATFESDAAELFGIRYTLAGVPLEPTRNLVPESAQGFPLRHEGGLRV